MGVCTLSRRVTVVFRFVKLISAAFPLVYFQNITGTDKSHNNNEVQLLVDASKHATLR